MQQAFPDHLAQNHLCRVRRHTSPYPPPLRTGQDCYQSSGSSLGLPERLQ
ncbi:hypothetical protein H6G36_30145 [Anabaena minutissima FACHB-250]|nr:hypothetical protein [Anabaena minutissima FACHB-250]